MLTEIFCLFFMKDRPSSFHVYANENQPKQSTSDVSTMTPSYSPGPDKNINVGEKDAHTTRDAATNFSSNDPVPYDLTPKHHIRSPIIEETESGVEAELLRSRGNLLSSSLNRQD